MYLTVIIIPIKLIPIDKLSKIPLPKSPKLLVSFLAKQIKVAMKNQKNIPEDNIPK